MTTPKAYKITPSGRLYLDGVEIPQDDRDAAYLTYAAWLREGYGPEKAEEVDAPDTPADDAVERLAIDAELTKLEERIAHLRDLTATPKETR